MRAQPAPTRGDSRADYGIDAPVVLRRFVVGGGLLLLAGIVLAGPAQDHVPGWVEAGTLFRIAAVLFAIAGVMYWGSRVGKLRTAERLIDSIPWRGDERVLDVGCGHGVLLIAAARRLETGQAVGVDIWQDYDQADNSAAATLENARREGVADRVEVRDGDACDLPFAEASFDVVTSSLALHNIPTAEGRERAVREMVRVLKPGGHFALVDIYRTYEYRRVLRDCGFEDIQRVGPNFMFVVPAFRITARKPAR